MPRNIGKQDVLIDPAEPWRTSNEPAAELEVTEELPTELAISTPAPGLLQQLHDAGQLDPVPSRRFCIQCGAEGVTAAKFCHACGTALDPAPVAGAGFAAELASRVTAEPVVDEYRPVREEDLTPAQRAARETQHLAALQAGQKDAPLRFQKSSSPDKILIHIVTDGFTFAGNVWMRGQELEIGPDHPRWAEVQRWIHMDDSQQMEIYGRVRFRKGPWPGRRSYAEGAGSFESVSINGQAWSGPSAAELQQADALEARRGRAVPLHSM